MCEKILRQNKTYTKFLPAFEGMKKLYDKNKPVIIAIDGRCGSGKTTLATLLAEVFPCNVFHMDDFFLPFEMKTAERLAKPGGNVHYERFEEEVLKGLKKFQTVVYRPYICSEGELGEPVQVEFKHINIVEGSYSMYPTLQQAYDYKIFLTVDSEVQKKRILNRNGEAQLKNFLNKWIPLEENYFSALNIEAKCDIIVDTTGMWS